MPDMSQWLKREDVRSHAESLIGEVRTLTRRSEKEIDVEHEFVARAVANRYAADAAILKEWFYASVGVIDPLDGETKETFYLSQVPNAAAFGVLNIVPWTNWVGDLYVRGKAALEQTGRVDELKYGPPQRSRSLPVGPIVDYFFRDAVLDQIVYRYAEVVEETSLAQEPVEPLFGLRQIIRTIDIDQNEQIRGPMHGVFILVGGPGVGKTTVALHRIPYLINEQVPYGRESNASGEAAAAERRFSQEDTLVVVWKPHLVPYLRSCLKQELGLRDFPDENVRHVDDWIEAQVRRYVTFGVRSLRISSSDAVDRIKLELSEDDIVNFLNSDFPAKTEARKLFLDLARKVRDTLSGHGYSSKTSPPFQFSYSGVQEALERILDSLPQPDVLGKYPASVDQQLRKEIRDVRENINELLIRYVEMLRSFYRSQLSQSSIQESLGTDAQQLLNRELDHQESERTVSRTDLYFLLWLIHIQTEGNDAKPGRHKPLGRYSHIVIDEAQYYEPLVLRLLADLAQLPDGVMTVVGDLEQRILTKGGLTTWEDAGLDVAEGNIVRLVTNYRWSKAVFDFLLRYRDVAKIKETLNPPRRWFSGEGRRPEIHTVSDISAEIADIVEEVSAVKSEPESERWTVAIIVPPDSEQIAQRDLVPLLTSCGIHARWANSEDVKESVDRVIVTNYENIVGLEFDFVCVMGVDRLLRPEVEGGLQALWVALTRARRFLLVTRTGSDTVFDHSEFAEHRS